MHYVLTLLLLATASQPLTVDEIVERYVAARGGRARLEAVDTLIYRGTYAEGSYESPNAAMALKRPWFKLVGDPAKPIGGYAEGYDGGAWEYFRSRGVVVRTVGPANAAIRRRASIDHPLIDYRARGTRLELLTDTSVDGRRAHRILMTLRDGFQEEILIDADSFLIIAERKAAPIHASGEPVNSETRIGDYREIGGVMIPHSFREVEIATGKELNRVQWRTIEVNTPIDVARFSPPELERTPEQAMLQRLFEERTDPAAALWTFHEYRRANREADLTKGIEFIAGQMKKMGDGAASAEALLEAVKETSD